jgi:hypothetical protein
MSDESGISRPAFSCKTARDPADNVACITGNNE